MNADQQHPPTATFEDRLLAQLRAVVAERGAAAAAEAEAPAARPAWRRGPRLALAGGAVTAAAAAALIVSAGGSGAAAAYAVEPQGDGEVSVEIRSLEDAKGLEEALGNAGIPASVSYLPAGMACREPRFRPVTKPAPGGKVTSSLSQSTGGPGGEGTVFTISRNAVGDGQTLVLTASPGPGGEGDAVQIQVAEGEVSPCEPVKAPAGAPAGGAPAGGGEGPATSKPGTDVAPAGAPDKGLSTHGD